MVRNATYPSAGGGCLGRCLGLLLCVLLEARLRPAHSLSGSDVPMKCGRHQCPGSGHAYCSSQQARRRPGVGTLQSRQGAPQSVADCHGRRTPHTPLQPWCHIARLREKGRPVVLGACLSKAADPLQGPESLFITHALFMVPLERLICGFGVNGNSSASVTLT